MKVQGISTQGPAVTPITVADAKAQLRVEHADDDALIGNLIGAATRAVEQYTGRALITQSWDFRSPRLQRREGLAIPLLPVQGLVAVKYRDAGEALQTASPGDFEAIVSDWRARIYPVYGAAWPSMATREDSIVVSLTMGYGDAGSDVPQSIRTAIGMLVDFWFHRPAAMDADAKDWPMPVAALLAQYRTGWVA